MHKAFTGTASAGAALVTAAILCATSVAAEPAGPVPLATSSPVPVASPRPTVKVKPVRRLHAVRPEPVSVKPVLVRISRPAFTLNTKPEVDLRDEARTLGVYQTRVQGLRGTCSVFALSFLLDFMYAKHFGQQNADFSEEFLNYASNEAIGEKRDGGFFDDLDLGYQTFGDVGEASAPYANAFNPNLTYSAAVLAQGRDLAPRLKAHFIKPWDPNTGLLPTQLLSIMLQIHEGRPVAAGLRWPREGKFKTETIAGITMMTAPPAADVYDGHSIVFVGYKVSDLFPGGGYLVFRNSWGSDFMDDGYGYMSFDYAKKYTNDLVEYVLK